MYKRQSHIRTLLLTFFFRQMPALIEKGYLYIAPVSYTHLDVYKRQVYEVVDNSIDESLAGYCDTILVTLNPDSSCTVADNGRGIPVDIHKEEGVSAAQVIMTQLHAGGKFDQNSYKVSGGLHGVGVSVVNALSAVLDLKIWRGGGEYFMRFKHGEPEAPLKQTGKAPMVERKGKQILKTGTEVTFWPSDKTFTKLAFDYATLEHRLRELAFLNSGVTLTLTDSRGVEPKSVVLHYEGGLEAFVKFLDRSKQAFHPTILVTGEREGITVEVAMEWTDSYHAVSYTHLDVYKRQASSCRARRWASSGSSWTKWTRTSPSRSPTPRSASPSASPC